MFTSRRQRQATAAKTQEEVDAEDWEMRFLPTVDGRNPAITSWYGKYPIIYGVSYMSGGAGFLNHQ